MKITNCPGGVIIDQQRWHIPHAETCHVVHALVGEITRLRAALIQSQLSAIRRVVSS